MQKTADIYRMVTPNHLCPWGIKALDLLKRKGFRVNDHQIASMDANIQYKKDHNVDETPQIFISGEHIGGYDNLRTYLGLGPDPKEGPTYQPVIAIFSVTLGMAVATSLAFLNDLNLIRTAELFIAFSMCALGIQKLRDLQSYANSFVQYDLLAQRYVPYAAAYAYIETLGGIMMIAGYLIWLIAPIVLLATTIGAISIIKAVYIEKRDLKCACVGGATNVPLGIISLIENFMMMGISIWMLIKYVK